MGFIMMKNMKTFALMGLAAALAFGHPVASYAGQWNAGTGENAGHWQYQNDDGSYPANCWQWIDGNNDGIAESYYFDQNGWTLSNVVTPDGFMVNADGAWTVFGQPVTKVVNSNGSIGGYAEGSNGSGVTIAESSDNYEESVSDVDVDDDSRWNREMAEEFVELLNEYREKKGNEPVELTDDAQYYAEIRAMQLEDNYTHSVDENDYIEKNWYGNEYITKNVYSAEDAIKSYKSSSAHWSGLTNTEDVTECGVGFYRMNNGKYAVSVNFNDFNDEECVFANFIK
jgi:uncharacterized protein YkwD